MEKDGAIEIVFNDSVPLSFYKKFLKIEDSNVPDVYFDRIVVFTREDDGHSVYFISEDKNAVKEANTLHIPVFAITDTNVDPTGIDYVIPANDDAIKATSLILDYFKEAIKEGKK